MSETMDNTNIAIEQAISEHEARNAEIRLLFLGRGIDLGEPRLIECHFWVWSPENAGALARGLVARGFRILAQRPAVSKDDPSLWNLEAGIMQSIELTMRREFTDELVRLAICYGGQYDGWGTRI